MFRYKEDITPICIILLLSALDFILYFTTSNPLFLFFYWVVMILPKGKICSWNHHHQHLRTFKNKTLNHLLEFFYALHTGLTTNAWVLHHVLGHHLNFLDQSKDESKWLDKNGKPMHSLRYTIEVASTAYYRAYQVGTKHPKLQKEFLMYSFITFSIVGLLTYLNPINTFFLFILPMIVSLFLTAWATHGHHRDLSLNNEMEASQNNTHKLYNLLTGNLGYHTAHHHKQGTHWSKLPQLHDKIKHQIPENLIKNKLF